MNKLFLLFSSPKPIGQLESKCIEIGRLATSLLILTDNMPLLQVLANGQKRLQKPSIPQLDSRIHCSTLLLPSVQECKDQQSLKVSLCCVVVVLLIFCYSLCFYIVVGTLKCWHYSWRACVMILTTGELQTPSRFLQQVDNPGFLVFKQSNFLCHIQWFC